MITINNIQDLERKAIEEYEKHLDYKRLAVIKNKPISELDNDDLEFLGIHKYEVFYGAEYYCRSIADSMYKLYFDRMPDGTFIMWHYALGERTNISTSSQLLYEVITKWRLQLHKQNQ